MESVIGHTKVSVIQRWPAYIVEPVYSDHP